MFSILFQFVYENSFLEKTGNDHSKAKNYINQVIAHLQTYFCHSSLGTQLEIKVNILVDKQDPKIMQLNVYSFNR